MFHVKSYFNREGDWVALATNIMKKFTKSRKALIIFCYTVIALFFAILAHTVNIEHKFVGEDGVRYFEYQLEDDSFTYFTYSKRVLGFGRVEYSEKISGVEYENYELVQQHFANNKLAYDTPFSLNLLVSFIIILSTILSFTTSQIEAVELDGKIYHVDKKRETRFHNEFTYIGLSFLICFGAYSEINYTIAVVMVIAQFNLITYFVRRKNLI